MCPSITFFLVEFVHFKRISIKANIFFFKPLINVSFPKITDLPKKKEKQKISKNLK